ncbi:MAG: hypothetical protein JWQ06_1539 [Mucilaginibacter sp.]|nr:hypothetical protein [Mucilaginibacter sp.]
MVEDVLVVVILTVVSFFKLSGIAEVSFLMVSTMVLVTESVLTESVVAEPLPLHDANDTAAAKAKKLILNKFFIFYF